MAYITKQFRDLPLNTIFSTTPTGTAYRWLKVSTRTARLGGNGAVYYFKGTDMCHVDSGHWAEMRASKEKTDG